jgi:hypothetical protein
MKSSRHTAENGGGASPLRPRRLRLAAGAALVAAGLVLAPTASAQSNGEDTAFGNCQMTGKIRFADPLGPELRETSFTDYAEGTCTGTVNGEFMANERVSLRAEGSGLLSCAANRVTSTGTFFYTRNTPTRSDDVEVDYIAESQGVFGQVVSKVRGRVSGEAVGFVHFHGEESHLRECEQGKFRGGTYDAVGEAITPMVG